VHPGAGRELEVLGDAPVEARPSPDFRIGEFQRVADPIVAFPIERGFREIVAGRSSRA